MLQELPELEGEGVITPTDRLRLENYYSNLENRQSHWATIAFAVLGAVLIGGGIILLLAHNWDQLTRPMRTIVAFSPLSAAVGLSIRAMRRNGTARREFAGLFHCLAIGACIAVIGQTYHVRSDTAGFLLSWAMLSMPMMFLLPSTGAFLIYLVLICSWTGAAQSEYGHAVAFGLLIIPAIIRVSQLIKTQRQSPATLLSLGGMVIVLPIALGNVMEHTIPGFWMLTFACLTSLIGLIGLRFYPTAQGWRNPLVSAALMGITALAFSFTWIEIWDHIGGYPTPPSLKGGVWKDWIDAILGLILASCWAALMVKYFDRKSLPKSIISTFPIFVGLGFFATSGFPDGEIIAVLLFNAFTFVLGVTLVIQGSRLLRLRQVNFGMSLLGLLLLARFYDSDFGFLARGIAFILIGIGFVAANWLLTRKKRRDEGAAK
jgi:hypothetical protein